MEKLKKKDRIDFMYHFLGPETFVQSDNDSSFSSCNFSSHNLNQYFGYSNNKDASVNSVH